MAGELRIERRYLPDPKRETQALLLLLGLGGGGIPVPREAQRRKDHGELTKDALPGEVAR